MAYESPITIMENEAKRIVKETENGIVAEISKQYGVEVDKEELTKALLYDRQQYDKGYKDALAEIRERVEKVIAEIHTLDDLNPDYPMDRTIHVSKWAVIEIINKYLGE